MLVGGVAALTAISAHAEDDSIRLEYVNLPAQTLNSTSTSGTTFWAQFKSEFDSSSADAFSDRFHPLKRFHWSTDSTDDGYTAFRDRINAAAFGAFSKSLTYSLREASLHLPFVTQMVQRQALFGGFVRTTVDSVQEESVSPLDPSYRVSEKSWWKKLSEDGPFRFGLRPLSENPYAFLGFRVGEGNQPIMLGHVRYHYEGFTDHRFELAMSVPIARGISMGVGTTYQLGQEPQKQELLVVKLDKEFHSGGLMHLGFEVQEHPSLFAGVSVPW
jgi:hypothetical protein